MLACCGESIPSDPAALTQLNLIPANKDAVAHTAINEDIILLERRRRLCFEGFQVPRPGPAQVGISPLVSPLADSRRTGLRKL
ncbi:MAG: hypothetical protein R2756_01035 [Bacteroidales bacterium]